MRDSDWYTSANNEAAGDEPLTMSDIDALLCAMSETLEFGTPPASYIWLFGGKPPE